MITQQDSHTHWSYCLCEDLLHTFILMLFQKFTCSIYLMKRKEETILHLTVTDLSCSLKHYGYNLSSVCSDSSTLSHWWSRTNQKPRIERLSECGLDCVDEDHCVRDAVRRTEFLLRDPQTLLFCWYHHHHHQTLLFCCWWTSQGDKSLYHCVWMSNWSESRSNSRTDHYIQTNTHHRLPSSWCSYMTLI